MATMFNLSGYIFTSAGSYGGGTLTAPANTAYVGVFGYGGTGEPSTSGGAIVSRLIGNPAVTDQKIYWFYVPSGGSVYFASGAGGYSAFTAVNINAL